MSIKGGFQLQCGIRSALTLYNNNSSVDTNEFIMKSLIQLVMCVLGISFAAVGEESVRQALHGTLARVAPTTIKEAVVVSMSEGASHFQKLPGK